MDSGESIFGELSYPAISAEKAVLNEWLRGQAGEPVPQDCLPVKIMIHTSWMKERQAGVHKSSILLCPAKTHNVVRRGDARGRGGEGEPAF